jgi:AcrR family transcriptional regulator
VPRSSPRLARRREETRARILRVAGRRFAADGVDHVRLDEIADDADVARGTLYNYFPTKESLICALLKPVLEQATRKVRGLEALGPRRGVDALLALYLELWREHPDPLRVAHSVPQMPAELAALHRMFLQGVLQIFERSARAGILRGGDGAMTARILARLAVPLLEIHAGHPRADVLFCESFHALLLSG